MMKLGNKSGMASMACWEEKNIPEKRIVSMVVITEDTELPKRSLL